MWQDITLQFKLLPNEVKLADMEMQMEKYLDWHKAIMTDNSEFITSTVIKSPESVKERYFNGLFISDDDGTGEIAKKHFGINSKVQC